MTNTNMLVVDTLVFSY